MHESTSVVAAMSASITPSKSFSSGISESTAGMRLINSFMCMSLSLSPKPKRMSFFVGAVYRAVSAAPPIAEPADRSRRLSAPLFMSRSPLKSCIVMSAYITCLAFMFMSALTFMGMSKADVSPDCVTESASCCIAFSSSMLSIDIEPSLTCSAKAAPLYDACTIWLMSRVSLSTVRFI